MELRAVACVGRMDAGGDPGVAGIGWARAREPETNVNALAMDLCAVHGSPRCLSS